MNEAIDWHGVEADAWSRNFDYKDYLIYRDSCQTPGEAMTEEAYSELCIACDKRMKEYCEEV